MLIIVVILTFSNLQPLNLFFQGLQLRLHFFQVLIQSISFINNISLPLSEPMLFSFYLFSEELLQRILFLLEFQLCNLLGFFEPDGFLITSPFSLVNSSVPFSSPFSCSSPPNLTDLKVSKCNSLVDKTKSNIFVLNSKLLNFLKSQCWSFSTSTTPHGYFLPLTNWPGQLPLLLPTQL